MPKSAMTLVPSPASGLRRLLAAGVVSASLIAAIGLGPAVAQEATSEPLDRIVAVVDEDPILWSDMVRASSLDLIERREDEDEAAYQRRLLDQLIDIRLRFHEVDRFGFRELPLAEVEEQLERVRDRFGGDDGLQQQLEAVGMTEVQLQELLAGQLMILSFVEERLGPRVFVSLEDIRRYHEEVLTPEMLRRGEVVPELGEVREQIRQVLREQRLNEEIEQWTFDLRARADISDFLEREDRDLPPVAE